MPTDAARSVGIFARTVPTMLLNDKSLLAWACGLTLFALSDPAAAQFAARGSFSVSQSGAATYSVAIPVPKGTGGIEPQLTLSYDSQMGNGIAGVGWTLAGLSSIQRCPKSPAIDGVRSVVKNDSSDKYCLDGQRLLAVQGADGADGTLYRTERESFSRITSKGSQGTPPATGPQHFVIKTKAGLTMEYGTTADSRIELQGAGNGVGPARAWALSKVSDTSGNFMRISYTEDNANGVFYPKKIEYTGNSTAGREPASTVNFEYESRSDAGTQFRQGYLSRTGQRLTRIWSTTTTAAGSAPAVVSAGETRLVYEGAGSPTTGRSRLLGMARCDGPEPSGTCMPPIVFGWTGTAPSFSGIDIPLPVTVPVPVPFQLVTGDLNADGKGDFVEIFGTGYTSFVMQPNNTILPVTRAFPNGWDFGVPSQYQLVTGDFDGDGRTDFMQVGAAVYYMFLSNGDGSFTAKSPASGTPLAPGLNIGLPATGYTAFIGDVNGDGRTDFMEFGHAGTSHVFLSKGDGNFTLKTISTQAIPNGTLHTGASVWSTVSVHGADYEGDGVADLMVSYSCGTQSDPNCVTVNYYRGLGDGGFVSETGPTSLIKNTGGVGCGAKAAPFGAVIDITGDGLPDCAVQLKAGVYSSVVNMGAGQVKTVTYDASMPAHTSYTMTGFIYGDFNGDGLNDMIKIQDNKIFRWTANGSGGFTKSAPVPLPNGWDVSALAVGGTLAAQIIEGDFDGDGRSDFGLLGRGRLYVFLAGDPYPDLILTIEPGLGLGAKMAVNYMTLPVARAQGRFVQEAQPAFPIVPVTPNSLAVVTEVITGDVAVNVSATSTTYRYGSATVEAGVDGRGFTGFRWVEERDGVTGMLSRTYYREDWPYHGLVSVNAKYTAAASWSASGAFDDGGAFSKVIKTRYACAKVTSGALQACPAKPGSSVFVYADQVIEEGRDLSGVKMPSTQTTTTFDAFGNPLTVQAKTLLPTGEDSGHSKTTTNVYSNDQTNWILGRLLRATVTATAPK